jgi:hypothetical protein
VLRLGLNPMVNNPNAGHPGGLARLFGVSEGLDNIKPIDKINPV